METDKLLERSNKLANDINALIAEFLDETKHQFLPHIEFSFINVSTMGTPQYLPDTRIELKIKTLSAF